MDMLTGIALAYKTADDTYSDEAPAFRRAVKSHLAKMYSKYAEAAKLDYMPISEKESA